MLIHGARSVITWAVRKKKNDIQSNWIRSLLARNGYNKTAVALANKTARVAWAVVVGGKYIPNYKSKVFEVRKTA